MNCPLKSGLECGATPCLADASECRCPFLVYYDPATDRDTSPLLMVEDESPAYERITGIPAILEMVLA